MDDFIYRDGRLHCERVPVRQIAEKLATPSFIYSKATLLGHYDRFAAAFAPLAPTLCFSIKSCANVNLCRLLAERGSGFDVVSGGELFRALMAGADPQKIVYAGVGKTDPEINAAIDARIGYFNIESPAELENLIRIASARKATARAALRINPDVDPITHKHTTTGKKETKFGVDLEMARDVFDRLGRDPHVKLTGLHLHIGSPVNTVEPYVAALRRALELVDTLRNAGHTIDTFDLGGGFGAHYRGSEAPDAATYAAALVPLLANRKLHVILEPGRSIAANAGILLTRVLYTKQSGTRRFAIVDAGMNDLVRPALYDAHHFIWPAEPGPQFAPTPRGETDAIPGLVEIDVVGPVCETGDFLGRARKLPPLQRGDLVAVFTAGAYGMTMSSNYNSRPRAAEVLVDGDQFRTIRRRETYDDLVAAELG